MKRQRKKLPKHYRTGFLVQMSRTTELGRRLNDTFRSLVADSGGIARQNTARLMLIERLTFLDELLRGLERQMVHSSDTQQQMELMPKWVQAVNSLMGLVRTLGMERPLDDPIDVLYRDPEEPEAEHTDNNGKCQQLVERNDE